MTQTIGELDSSPSDHEKPGDGSGIVDSFGGNAAIAAGSSAGSLTINFDADTPGLPPATGGPGQPTSIAGNSVLVQSSANGINTQPVVLTGEVNEFANVGIEFAPVSSGILQVEATVSFDELVDSFFLQTAAPFGGAVATRLITTSTGQIEDDLLRAFVGTYTPATPFAVRETIDVANHVWSVTIDNELNGFGDDPTVHLPFENPADVVPSIGAVDASFDIFPVVVPNTASVAYDDIRISTIPEVPGAQIIGDLDGSLGDHQLAADQDLSLASSEPLVKVFGDVTGALRDHAAGGNDRISFFGTTTAAQVAELIGDAGAGLEGHARGGNDEISASLEPLGSSKTLRAFGDTSADMRDHAHGGDDTLTGNVVGDVFLFGDAGGNLYGHAKGGNDSLTARGLGSGTAVGDAGGDMFDHARGGDDVITDQGNGTRAWGDAMGEMHDHATGGNDTLLVSAAGRVGNLTAFGDASSMSGHASGGNDELTYVGAGPGLGGPGVRLVGDAETMSDDARGGDDLLTGAIHPTGAALLIGDAETMLDYARGGDDVLVSGKEDDFMYGDAVNLAPTARGGHDRFVFGPDNGQDTIGDFCPGEDKIDLRELHIDGFAKLDIDTLGADSIIHLEGTNQITVANDTHLVASDFLFS